MNRPLLLAALTLPAFALPAGAAATRVEGLTCALAVQESAGEFTGTVSGGPVAVADPAASVQVICVVLLVVDGNQGTPVATAGSAPSPGVTVLAPTAVAFAGSPTGRMVQLEACTEVRIHRDGQPPEVKRYDHDNNPSNGVQCAPASKSGGPTTIHVVQPTPFNSACVTYRPEPVPPLPLPPEAGVCL